MVPLFYKKRPQSRPQHKNTNKYAYMLSIINKNRFIFDDVNGVTVVPCPPLLSAILAGGGGGGGGQLSSLTGPAVWRTSILIPPKPEEPVYFTVDFFYLKILYFLPSGGPLL